jgi:hypothetical protein
MVRTAHSLARLWARLERFHTRIGRSRMRPVCARDVNPPEPWLASVPPNAAISGVIAATLLAEGLLLYAAVSPNPPDRRRFCLIVQHVSCSATSWSAVTLRAARTVGVTLAPTVRDETHGSSLSRDIYILDGRYAA